MFEKILVPYCFDDDEQKLINENYKSHKDWSKSNLQLVKNNLKQYLRYVQKNQCCYCRQDLGFDYRLVDIEHIVDKRDHWSFGFEPRNLALSCPACNSCKTDQETLKDKSVKEYPEDGDSFVIIHPYFDNYSDHIDVHYPVFVSWSKKGDKTIEYCKLNRLRNVEARQKETMQKMSLVNALLNGSIAEGHERSIFAAIKSIIASATKEEDDDEKYSLSERK